MVWFIESSIVYWEEKHTFKIRGSNAWFSEQRDLHAFGFKKESLKIPMRYTECVNRRTDNKMANRKREKRTNNGLQNTTQKTKD